MTKHILFQLNDQQSEATPANRAEVESDILRQVRDYIQETIRLCTPESWSQQRRKAIEESVLTDTRLVLDALSTTEIQSKAALRMHIDNAVSETKRLIRQGGFLTQL